MHIDTVKPLLYHQIPLPESSKLDAIKALWTAKPWGMLLENASATLPPEKHLILVCEPIITLKMVHQQLEVDGFKLPAEVDNDPFKAMKHILQSFEKVKDSKLPFTGGFVGYLGYDVARSIESLPEISQKDLSLPDFAMGFYPLTILINYSQKCLTIAGLSGFQKEANEILETIHHYTPAEPTSFQLKSTWQSNMTRSEYLQKFNRIKEYILAGDCYQVNLAQRWQAKYSGDPYAAYALLSRKNKVAYSAFIRLENQSILSVSPEKFINASGKHCETSPIKGTRPRSKNTAEDKSLADELISSQKDGAENVMIVDLLRNDFSKVCKPHSVKVPQLCKLESFQAVHHLVSTVTGTLEEDYDNTDLLKACFPGGSITGAPKIRAMEIIEELEPHRRSIYCGSIGYLSCNGNMDTSIAIRTLVCENNRINCWAGGGLVVDSEAETEYQETFHKVSQILPILQQLTEEETSR